MMLRVGLISDTHGLLRAAALNALRGSDYIVHAGDIGTAHILQEGEDAAIITYGMGVHWALDYARRHPELSLYILDLRSLLPFDEEALAAAARATGKVLILHEDTLTGGLGGEIAAWIGEHAFAWLDAPVMRCASLDTPVPFAPELERNFLASSRLDARMEEVLRY